MPTRTEAIKAFLLARTHPDLANLYSHGMECQVNVAHDGGTRIEGDFHGVIWHGWTDGIQTWKAFRIPHNASTEPEYSDRSMSFNLDDHAEGIGMTGWNWNKKLSQWVAFDFDAITGHSIRHTKKLEQDELDRIQESLEAIPWVTIRKSSGGKGLHIYVFLNPVSTANHAEHRAIARAILGKMSGTVGFDLEASVDVCGQNMWVWHRKMKGTEGLALLKQGTVLMDIPPHWQDHIDVVTGRRRRNLPKFIGENSSDVFEELTGQAQRILLDDQHKKLIKWLEDHGTQSWWDIDHHMLVSHTFYLKQAHEELHLRGIFETLAQGTEAPNDCNCFMFPLRQGGWVVRRYSMGVAEASSWDQDGRGWTRCYYNVDPDLNSIARAKGGIEDTNGAFIFNEAEIARDAAIALGSPIPEIPIGLKGMKSSIKPHKDGRIVFTIEGDQNRIAADKMQGWLHKSGKWTRIFTAPSPIINDSEVMLNDDFIRHVVTSNGDDYGWMIRGDEENWRSEPLTHVSKVLESTGRTRKEVSTILGSSILKCWTLVNLPFQPEYPGDRTWNRDAAQFRFPPSQNEKREYPTWLKILRHVGAGLDDAIKMNPWAKVNGIASGADYLKIWIASLFQRPLQPLPYLFLYGSQNCGKSILPESLARLLTKGYTRGENALTNQQGFNGELAGAILCSVEEMDLKKHKEASTRIKDWVTALELPIHPKGGQVYHVPNSTHWIHTTNDPQFCPIFPGDSRITMIYVPDLTPEDRIPKSKMLVLLEKEAPDFMAELLDLEIPPSNDRLNVPVVVTAEKAEIQRINQTPLEMFLTERCHYSPGSMIKLGELYEKFVEWGDPNDIAHYTKTKFGRELPPNFPKGRSRKDGNHYVGNISFDPPASSNGRIPLKASPPDSHGFVFLDENKNGYHT